MTDSRLDPRFDADFGTLAAMVRDNARRHPDRIALIQDGGASLDYAGLDALADRLAAALQGEGIVRGAMVGLLAGNSNRAIVAAVAIMRAGGVVALLPSSAEPGPLAAMIADCRPKLLLHDGASVALLDGIADRPLSFRRIDIDDDAAFDGFLAPAGVEPMPVELAPEDGANLIYSSGTTGVPKGILIPHALRWTQLKRPMYRGQPVTMVSTPLYSNTTLSAVMPTLARGGTVLFMGKFDVARFLSFAAENRATHAMLVPVQYRRILAHPDFDPGHIPSLRVKLCTSAPFGAELKEEVLRRWPGELHEFYGMTEGGLVCVLAAHDTPDKLHSVGRPTPGHALKFIDEEGREVAAGEAGEIVGRSPGMMTGYYNRPGETEAVWWYDADGTRYMRTGDVGRLDPDGFLVLVDRRKDMIISGGFNIYPSDLEAVLSAHPAIEDVSIFGVPSEQWGETPVAAVVLRRDVDAPEEHVLLAWANARLGKMQRLADIFMTGELPRSVIGKVLKRDLRDAWLARRRD